jgi:uncharacterized protein YjdB
MLLTYLTSGRAQKNAPAFIACFERLVRLGGAFLLTTLVAFVASCDNSVTATGSQVSSIQITPASLALSTGTARALSVTVRDESGSPMSVGQVFWSTHDPRVVTVSSQGIVTAVAAGATQVAASKGGKSAVAPVTVSALPAALVRVTPTTSNVMMGATTTLSAEVLDAGGGLMKGYSVTWSSASPGIATVNSSGVVTGVALGNVVITAAAAGLNGTAVVTVRPVPVASVAVAPSTGSVQVGKVMQLTATMRDAAGKVLTGRSVTWASGSATTATVAGAGVVTALKKGTATISATSEGKTGTATITVR